MVYPAPPPAHLHHVYLVVGVELVHDPLEGLAVRRVVLAHGPPAVEVDPVHAQVRQEGRSAPEGVGLRQALAGKDRRGWGRI